MGRAFEYRKAAKLKRWSKTVGCRLCDNEINYIPYK